MHACPAPASPNVVDSHMEKRSEVFEHLGPYCIHPPLSECCELTERVWHTYHKLTGGHRDVGQASHEFLVTRMLYIAEITSTAVRLNVSWALTHAAMSLLRGRYEQTVRFSWLVRNPDPSEFAKYERAIYAKMNSIVRNMDPTTRQRYVDRIGPLPAWATEQPTKEERAFLDAWSTLDLKSMAKKRDALPPIVDTVLAKEGLAHSYEAIYSQFSSVAHYDRFSIELLGLQKGPDGKLMLATQPHWPNILLIQNLLFDIIQCFEAAQICHKKDAAQIFEALLAEWIAISKKVVPR
jgi:hypothetical protein